MVKRLFLLSLMVLAVCGASAGISMAGGPPAGPCVMPPPGPPCPPPLCGPAKTTFSQVKEQIVPVPAQLRRVRVVAPYLAGIAWPRTPLAFFGNPQTFPNPLASACGCSLPGWYRLASYSAGFLRESPDFPQPLGSRSL
jgi:hypothetical protein